MFIFTHYCHFVDISYSHYVNSLLKYLYQLCKKILKNPSAATPGPLPPPQITTAGSVPSIGLPNGLRSLSSQFYDHIQSWPD